MIRVWNILSGTEWIFSPPDPYNPRIILSDFHFQGSSLVIADDSGFSVPAASDLQEL
jgi:hypothetical protein